MDPRSCLYAGIYRVRCGFSSVRAFVDYLNPHIHTAATVRDTLAGINRALEALSPASDLVDSEQVARDILVSRDLHRIQDALQKLSDTDVANLSNLPADLELFNTALQDLGLSAGHPRVEIVEQFPHPFDKFTWSAFTPDAEDERRYGIPRGLYFRRASIKPYAGQALLAHELIHAISGQRDPDLLAMGLEEGLAEILGSLFLTTRRLGSEIAQNLFIYARHSSPLSKMWSLYLDHTRQAAVLYRDFGLEGLIALLNSGRRAIHEAERNLLRGNPSPFELPKGGWDPGLDRLLDYVLLIYPTHYVISPLSRYLAEYVEEGATVDGISERARVPSDLARGLLERLSTQTGLLVLAKDRIAYSNAAFYCGLDQVDGLGLLRYWIDV